MSNAISAPSGLTSTFIHVPSDVSNSIVSVGPSGSSMFHFGACSCPAGMAMPSAHASAVREDALRENAFFIGEGSIERFVVQTCPEVPARNRAIGTPRLPESDHPLGRWPLAETIRLLNRLDDAKIAER